MEVLRPQLLWVGSRCYRVSSGHAIAFAEDDDHDEDHDHGGLRLPTPYQTEEACDANYDIEKLANGQFKTSVRVANAYFGNIIGMKGVNKKRLENETRTRVKIPSRGTEGDIVITGQDKKGVTSARTRVELIVDAARQKQPFTHFLSIPITDPIMKDAFLDFQQEVLKECHQSRGFDESIFQNPEKLHLTLGTMPLLDNAERQKAIRILNQCEEDLIRPMLTAKPLTIQIAGIEYMNDDPADVDILYAKIADVDGSERLQTLCDQLVERYECEGLMQRQYERVKLHVTVMNTLFRNDVSGVTEVSRPRQRTRESFDATAVLKHFGDYHFCDLPLTSLQLSQRHSTSSNGYYAHSAEVNLSKL